MSANQARIVDRLGVAIVPCAEQGNGQTQQQLRKILYVSTALLADGMSFLDYPVRQGANSAWQELGAAPLELQPRELARVAARARGA